MKNKPKIEDLKIQLDSIIDEYTNLFCVKQECFSDGWIGPIKGGINCFSDCFISFDDIRTDLELNVPKGEIFNWYYENLETEKSINYYSYTLGLRIKDLKN